MQKSMQVIAWASWVSLTMLCGGTACAQNYPNKPIRLVAPGIGGAADYAARVVAPGLGDLLGQSVVVENRAPGIIASETASRAPADGYTLLIQGNAMWIGPFLQKANYDAIKDFSPVSLVNTYPNLLVVHPSLPVNSVKELLALAKAKPGQLNYASGAVGGSTHLASELFKSMGRVNIVGVQYKSFGEATKSVLGGETQIFFSDVQSVVAILKSGKLKGLAVTSLKPSPLVPDLPPVASAGLPGFEILNMSGIFVPAKTPDAIINRLSAELGHTLSQPNVKEKMFNGGAEAVSSSPSEFAAAIKADMATQSKIIKDAGIHLE